MGNSSIKIVYLLLGLVLGFLSGLCSTYHLDQLGAFWRPPVVFWLFLMFYSGLWERWSSLRLIALLPLFLITHWLVITLFAFSSTSMMGLGAVLAFSSTVIVLDLKRIQVFLIVCVFLGLIGLGFDFGFEILENVISRVGWMQLGYTPDCVSRGAMLMVILWQAIAFPTIVTQLHHHQIQDLKGD